MRRCCSGFQHPLECEQILSIRGCACSMDYSVRTGELHGDAAQGASPGTGWLHMIS